MSAAAGLLLLFLSRSLAGLPELETSHVCSRYEMRLRCDTDHLVAVHEAFFTSGQQTPWPARPDCEPKAIPGKPCREDLRQVLNNRCSGAVHCLFSLNRDHAERRCRGEGSLVVRYRCLPEKSLDKLCGVRIRRKEGYLTSPGFPHYYPALKNCTWKLEAAPGQTIVLQMLDVSTRRPPERGGGPLVAQDCQDLVSVMEGDNPLLVACGEDDSNLRIVYSASNRVDVHFTAEDFVPSRGFLLKYKMQGCPTPPPPQLGYLVHRTQTAAVYKCCKDHLFPDTLHDTRTLMCQDGNDWNDSVPNCASRLELALNGTVLENSTDSVVSDEALTARSGFVVRNSLAEILVPCLVMGGLLLGNAVVVMIIFKLRKRRLERLRSRLPTVALLTDPKEGQFPSLAASSPRPQA